MYHDSAALEALISSLVSSANYRGHLDDTFPITRNRVTVYSPCWPNDHRKTRWLRCISYLTFLWVFCRPCSWFMTRRWEVGKVIFAYSIVPDNGNRQFVTKSELAFYKEWKSSIRRAVLGKKQGCMDEEHKLATEEALSQAGRDGLSKMPATGNGMADGASAFTRQAVNAGSDVAMAGGWARTGNLGYRV